MALDLAAWAVIFVAVRVVGRGALALLDADDIRARPELVVRAGDRLILAAWIGVIVCAITLLGVSLFTALTPIVSASVAVVLCALGALALWRAPTRLPPRASILALPTWAIVPGVAAVAVGAAALASDPVTLYDSLVYHVGLIRWLREAGTVPGMALIHNRLGHVSAWFTIAAAFDSGSVANRASNIPLGFALVLTGIQTGIATARIAARRAVIADWFLALGSAALIWAIVVGRAASPSPDVATNALILVAAWAVLVVSPGPTSFTRRLIPFVIALGACSMKLFAVPAVIVTGAYALLASPSDGGGHLYLRRVLVCAGLAVLIVGPFIAANLVASGCPAFPSPIGCLDAPWSIGASRAADYAAYVRDVARWQRRGELPSDSIGWIAPWIIDHPWIALVTVICFPLGIHVVRRVASMRDERPPQGGVDGVSTVAALGMLGAAFAAWQAPAPRFLYAFVLAVPALALSLAIHSRARNPLAGSQFTSRGVLAFVATSIAVGSAYAVASQKLNLWSAVERGTRLVSVTRADLLLPAAPAPPLRLFRWRVNDAEVLTPVPQPVADTLDYRSAIVLDSPLEKCSAAPIPCTPYLPRGNVRLRRPALGIAGGFVRDQRPSVAGRALTCVGEVDSATSGRSLGPEPAPASNRCGDERR
jgi:hypothetical protein